VNNREGTATKALKGDRRVGWNGARKVKDADNIIVIVFIGRVVDSFYE
jgi:hypothetical protein